MKVGIIGGGPAGLSAAIALGCEGIDAVCVAPKFGGRMDVSPLVENIPGFVGGIAGTDYNTQLVKQADGFGVQRVTGEAVAVWGGWATKPGLLYGTGQGYVHLLDVDAIVIASGITMDAPTTPTEVNDRKAQVVVGGGDAAVQVALQHAATGVPTVLAVRGNDLSKCSAYLRQRAFKADNLRVRYNATAEAFGSVVMLKDSQGKLTERVLNASLQTLVGGTPKAADLFGVEQDERGFILTDGQFHTSRPNVFAVGDVRSGSIKRVAVAAGEGIAVGHIVANYLRAK